MNMDMDMQHEHMLHRYSIEHEYGLGHGHAAKNRNAAWSQACSQDICRNAEWTWMWDMQHGQGHKDVHAARTMDMHHGHLHAPWHLLTPWK
jgi:hypothetical protein